MADKKQIEIPDVVDLVRVAEPIANAWKVAVEAKRISDRIESLCFDCVFGLGYVVNWVDEYTKTERDSRLPIAKKMRLEIAGVGSDVLGILDSPHGCRQGDGYIRHLAGLARINIAKSGMLDLSTLMLMTVRACGDMANSILRHKNGDCGFQEIEDKALEVGEICVQILWLIEQQAKAVPHKCRICGCTDDDCAGCIERTGQPCHWVAPDLCSACEAAAAKLPKPCITRMVLTYGPSTRRRKPAGKGA